MFSFLIGEKVMETLDQWRGSQPAAFLGILPRPVDGYREENPLRFVRTGKSHFRRC
jgi:hypothetical protein